MTIRSTRSGRTPRAATAGRTDHDPVDAPARPPLRRRRVNTMTITADDLTAGIADAIRARDFPAMADMLRMLTTADPRQAGRVCETIRTALPDAPVQADREPAAPAPKMAASR